MEKILFISVCIALSMLAIVAVIRFVFHGTDVLKRMKESRTQGESYYGVVDYIRDWIQEYVFLCTLLIVGIAGILTCIDWMLGVFNTDFNFTFQQVGILMILFWAFLEVTILIKDVNTYPGTYRLNKSSYK